MKSNKRQRIVSIVLSLCMVLSMSAFTSASAASKSDVMKDNDTSRISSLRVDADKKVTAIVTLSGDAQIDKELSGASDSSVSNARKKVQSRQQSLLNKMSKSFDYELKDSYSVLLNGLAISTEFKNLAEIEDMEYVTGVYLANSYSIPDYSAVPMTETSGDMISANVLRSYGFNGDGTVIAVLDTGLNIDHEAFQDYGMCTEAVLTKSKVEGTNTTSRGEYVSTKIPFAYDYADNDANVADKDGHGTHVAGIAAGYTEASDGAVEFSGQAPAAQILAMKIFSDEGAGTDSSIYISALEDAYLLDADVVNMSIGATNGFTYDAELEDEVYGNIYKKLEKAGVIMCVAAGNEYSMAYENLTGHENTVPASYTDYGTVASPSTYEGNISIASIENSYIMTQPIVVGDKSFGYTDSNTGDMMWFDAFAGKTLKYVMIDGVGELEDFEDATYRVSYGEEWIAVVQRGEINFSEKMHNAAVAGAAGMICYNNTDGDISMQIEEFEIPSVSITMASGKILADNAKNKVGTLTVGDEYVPIRNNKAFQMSDFSCWGTTSDLAFKPQITAPGGNIYSADATTNDGYIVYSGTSMATPNAAGLFACILDCLRTDLESYDRVEMARTVRDIAYSTSEIIYEKTDVPFSPRKQGAGLIDGLNIINATALIENSLLALKDSKEGVFNLEFTVRGLTDEAKDTFTIVPTAYTDFTFEDSDTGEYFSNLSSYELLSSGLVEAEFPKKVTLKGTEPVTVKGTIKVTEEGKELLDEIFSNGCFIEGFIKLQSGLVDVADMHATYMGYYGDWTKAPIVEDANYSEIVDYEYYAQNNSPDGTNTYADLGYSGRDFMYGECIVGVNEVYLYSSLAQGEVGYLGDNAFDYRNFDSDSMAFSSHASPWAYADCVTTYLSQIRNAAHTIMVVSNQETGEVYFVDDTPFTRKLIYDPDVSTFIPTSYFMWDGKNTYDENSETYGQYVENDTMIDFKFYAWLDYDKEAQEKFAALDGDYTKLLSSDWNSKIVYSYSAWLDTEMPTVENLAYSSAAQTLDITVRDNHKLGFVGVLDSIDTDGQYVDSSTPETGVGESFRTVINVADCVENGVFYLEAADYALNWATQEVYIENNRLVIKDYGVYAFDDNGEVDEEAVITLSRDGITYNNGDGLEVGEYDIFVDGEDTNQKLTISYFGENYAEIGDSLQEVTLNVVHNGAAFDPDDTLTLVGADTEVDFAIAVEDDEEETEISGKYVAMVLPGSYEVYADNDATGIVIEVASGADNSAELEYFTVTYHSNTKEYLGEAPATEYHFKGANFAVTMELFDNGDIEFLGWNTARNAHGSMYQSGDTFENLRKNIVLYAIWENTDITPEDGEVYLGDVNCDGKIDMIDVTSLQKIIAQLETFEKYGESSEANADTNKSGNVNMEDVVTIQKYIAQLIKEF